uniref:Retinoic acid induced 1 n=1 Tax=Gasterosteus aculeatus TaxID=69293 RepID=G3PEF0_GASAC
MQSFRERSGGYHSNQPCYQQEPHELSRLETYRQHPLMAPTGGAGTGGGPKDCYSQQAYPGYPGNGGGNGSGNGGSPPSQAKKAYRGSKVPPPNPSQHLQGSGGYTNHMGPGSYSAQYISEGQLQQKWEDSAQLAQYDQELVGRIEAGGTSTPGSSQYIDQSMLGHSQTQCHQPSTPAYTSPHHQAHPPNPAPSPLIYPQSHLHYPQHSASPSPYMEKCSPMPHCYKGYSIPPNPQYSRQMSSHSNLKQGGYRSTSSSYGYQQPSSRVYEQQPPLQAMTNPQEPHPKYQHYSQPQQSYCLSELSVRSPEQYYQTCSPSSSHSPARSVGRSPSYSSTPSPLMTNPESFQYGQPPMTPGPASSSSSSSAGMQEQTSTNNMLMPPRSHPSPNVPHAAPHSYTTTPQVPTMKERFSEKLLSNPSLWSLNALTSQVENISNNVQQLLLSEALVANKKGGSGASIKKVEEYKGPPYPDGGGSVGGGPMQDPYSTPQHQAMPMELHEGGYSSSSDEQLERGYYYCGQGRSPAQAPSNTQLSLDTASSCSMTSPDDMSTRSGDSGLHNLTPDPSRSHSGQGRDGMNTPVKSIGDERSPISITIPSPMKQERDSPSDIQQIIEPVKENFEESAWTEKSADKEEVSTDKSPDSERYSDTAKSTDNLEKWSDEEKCPALYSKVYKGLTEKIYCYKETMYQTVHSKYDPDTQDSVVQSPAALSDSSHKEHFGPEMKSEAFKSESPTASESSVKTLPFISRGDLEQDQYSTEKEDSSDNTSPTPQVEALDESNSDKRESRDEEDEEDDESAQDEVGGEGEIQKQKHALSPPLSLDVGEDLEEGGGDSLTEDHINRRGQEKSFGDLCSRTDSTELHTDTKSAGAPAHQNAAGACARESAIGDTAPQPQSAMPVFSALNDKTPPTQARDHIDHNDAKVLEPDSPQLPGKSILPSAPCWADTPPSPKKQQLNFESEGGGEEEGALSPRQKPCMPPIKTLLFSDPMDQAHLESIVSQTPKMLTDGFCSRMCTRSFNAPDLPPKVEPHVKRKPGPKPGSKPGLKPGPKPGTKSGPKTGPKPGPKPGLKQGLKPGPKPGPKPGTKPGPKPGPKPVPINVKPVNHDEKQANHEVNAPRKEGKNMVLRSRKPSQEKLAKEKVTGEDILTQTRTEMKATDDSPKVEEHLTMEKDPTSIPNAVKNVDIPADATETSEEKTLFPLKRKPSPEMSTTPAKKKRGPKPKPKSSSPQTPLEEKASSTQKGKGVHGPRKKRGPPKNVSVVTPPPKDTPPNIGEMDINSDVPVVAPQCPTKTKVLPPRKGRGQKYEAMVQKITSPSSKKHLPIPPMDSNLSPTKSTRTKRKRWAMVESTDASIVALEAGSLIVTTPRLAKQRAIKNNHEMHLKQKRKKRKGQAPLEEPEADEITEAPQVTSTELVQKPRRGRKPSANLAQRKRGKASPEQIPGKPMKVHKKPGPKPGMKDAMEVIEAVVRAAGCERAVKEEREKEEVERREREIKEKAESSIEGPSVAMSEKQTEIISLKRIRRKPVHQSSKLSFCPYIRINNSRDFSSWCAIVNKPEDAVVFQRRRKKGILRMRNPFTVAKVVPHAAAMLQGPLVKRDLIDRCLTCCLCGKPANYRDLGDLCGPYYTEDGVPRKLLTVCPTESIREDSQKTNDPNGSSSEEPSSSKNEGESSTEKEDNSETTTQEEGGPRRITLRERFRRMKQLRAISAAASSDREGGDSMFERLQMEAEAKEHWAHENCAIWTKGVIMVAGRLYGLREAANNSAQTSCYKCQIVGASLNCCWRGCSHKYHYVCAKEIGCTFHEDDFSIKCPKHEQLP